MDGNRRLSLVVGAFVLIAVGAAVVAILSLSSQQGIWRDRYQLVGHFDNVQGLIPNAPVWLAGKQVGRVESVDFEDREASRKAVRVVLQVDHGVREQIREDSVASIGTIGLLGDRYVEISLGTGQAAALAAGGELRTINPTDVNLMIDKGAVALESVAVLAANLNEVVSDFRANVGGRRLAESIGDVADLVREVQDGDGLLHSLIYDQYEGSGVQSIERSLVTFEGILEEIANGHGVLHSLIYDELQEQDIVLEALAAGSKLNSILAKVDSGEGTLGLMVNDPTLYEDLKLLVGGANRSALVRTMINLSTEQDN
jgi:phospholipid/cholesterol/gamma-HCH transport system substrate-binding protein